MILCKKEKIVRQLNVCRFAFFFLPKTQKAKKQKAPQAKEKAMEGPLFAHKKTDVDTVMSIHVLCLTKSPTVCRKKCFLRPAFHS